MALPTPRPGDQRADGLLIQADLPAGWNLAARFPGERTDDASDEIDRVLGYDDQETGESADSEQNETADGRWRYIEHEATATRVMIRLQRQLYASPEEVRITGVVYLPWRPGDPITSRDQQALVRYEARRHRDREQDRAPQRAQDQRP